MAKTYILEPTELEFSGNPVNSFLGASLENTQFYGLTADEIKNLIPDGSIVDINNGDKFITASDDEGVAATRDGAPMGPTTEEFAGFDLDNLTRKVSYLSMISTVTTSPGKYTVSIYTETEDAPKNTSYELHGHSDVERIRYKLKKKAEQGDSSSGGAGVFIVGATVSFASRTLDKTWAEINDAANSGKLVVIGYRNALGKFMYEYVTAIYNDGGYYSVLVLTLGTNDDAPTATIYKIDSPNDYPSHDNLS